MDKVKILENFVDDSTCDNMIEVYKKLFVNVDKYIDGRKLRHNQKDPEILDFLKIYIDKLSKELNSKYYVRDLLLSIYEEGAFVEPHVDFTSEIIRESLGVLFYFNDNFQGGEVYFSDYNFEYHPKKGSVLIFPCNDIAYKHGVKPIISGVRYTMPVEITEKKELEVIAL